MASSFLESLKILGLLPFSAVMLTVFRSKFNGFSFEVYVDPFETEEFSCSRPGFFAEL